jgi:glycosyltransferase involved in cell wall biosynthesis
MEKKKVLIITYYWYPSGGIGVLRCLKIAKYLRQFGWEPIIYTAENPHYPSIDESNAKDIPPNITVIKQPIFEPYHLYKKFTGKHPDTNVNHALVASEKKESWQHKLSVWIRSNFFIPDARAFWIKPSVRFLVNYLKNNPVDAIFSDGPPHSNTRIACLVKQNTGIPWLCDFQDPWTQMDLYERLNVSSWAWQKHKKMEKEAFHTADAITIVSQTWKKDLESIGAKNVSVLPWGYDQDDFKHANFAPDWKLTLTHTGLLGEDRNPENLFIAIKELSEEIEDFKQLFKLQLVGEVDISIKQSVEKHKIASLVTYIPQVPRREALQYIINTQVLLLLLNDAGNIMGRIPGKFFEYLAAKRPIICLGIEGSDVDKIIRQTKSGISIHYTDKQEIKRQLLMFYQKYKETGVIESQTENIEEFTNKNLTKKVAMLLDKITQKM